MDKQGKTNSIVLILGLVMLLTTPIRGDTITVMAVGDIMMGSTYPDNRLPPEGGDNLFADVESVLASADLTMGNLEGPLCEGGTCTKTIEKGKCYAFRTPPGFGEYLKNAGFDFMNCANNHANDFGAEGVASTQRTLNAAGIKYGGPDKSAGEFDMAGTNVVILPFSVSSGMGSILDIEQAQRIVAEQSRLHDIVIVSFHGGGEGVKFLHTVDTFEYYMGWPRGNVVEFAHAVVDSGADFVWGHGPHVPRALEMYKDRLIAYSLGNFCTWGFNLDDERGYAPILQVVLDPAGVFLQGKIISALQRTCKYPVLDPDHKAALLVKQLSAADFPKSSPVIGDDGAVSKTIRVPE